MRLGYLVRGDIHFQWEYGFYFIYFISMLLCVCVIAALPGHWKKDITVTMIYSDPTAMGLFFTGTIVLLEKNQKILNATVISPVKVPEYILSKTIVLIAISTIIILILGLVPGNKYLFGTVVGTTLTSIIFIMLGIITTTRISDLNRFLTAIMSVEIIYPVPPIVGLSVELPGIFCPFPFVAYMNLVTGKSSLLSFDMIFVFAALIILHMTV